MTWVEEKWEKLELSRGFSGQKLAPHKAGDLNSALELQHPDSEIRGRERELETWPS